MIDGIAEWLKTTVLGVIVLGACGSLIALLILYILRMLFHLLALIFRKVLPQQANRIVAAYKHIRGKVIYSYGYRLGAFSAWNPAWGVAFYFAYHVLCSVCLLLISATLTLIVSVIVCGTKTGTVLTTTIFFLTVLVILSAFWSLRHFLYVFLPYRNFLDVLVSTRHCAESSNEQVVTDTAKG